MNWRDIDTAALEFAGRVRARQPRGDFLSNILGGFIGDISGANYTGNKVGSYYQSAMNDLVNKYGSPAAKTFGNEESAALQPQFNQEDENLKAQEAAAGITQSGAAKADFGDLQRNQAGVLAGAEAPLYSQALGEYGNIAGAGAGAQSNAYQNTLDQFYAAAAAAATGLPQSPGNSQDAPGGQGANAATGFPTAGNGYGAPGSQGANAASGYPAAIADNPYSTTSAPAGYGTAGGYGGYSDAYGYGS